MFILVFTCLSVRTVHFELLPDMLSRNFILAFQRFCNMYRPTIPQYIYSDNAKSFSKGGVALENSLRSGEFKAELDKCNINPSGLVSEVVYQTLPPWVTPWWGFGVPG